MHDLLINVTSEHNFGLTVHLLIDYLLEVPKAPSTKQKLSTLLNVPSAGDDLTVTLKLVENLFRQYCLNELTEAELRAHFSNLTAATQATLVDVLEQRKPEVAQFLINEVNAKAHPLMESFDWDVKWIMGNSSLASVREQIATVALNCRGKDQRLQQVRFEMDRARLGEMIRLLEEVGGSAEVDK
ncbi:uncharacterized protein LOC120428244 [Culex pipiens pallens]|uniref:uncharacterized protein LOC120428244 n=1 Tax=Culex pipiens pallens TaxID=42434 RepID=UPI0019548237|nr:uncharacterized protein LOC120428244 [Culex pipiens pallens]